MSLIANINTDVNGNIIIQMKGTLNYDTNVPLKDELLGLSTDHPMSKITLDFQYLEFVGSSGIGQFVDLLNGLNSDRNRIFMINVKSEFLKVFNLYKLDNLADVIQTIDSFDNIGDQSQETYLDQEHDNDPDHDKNRFKNSRSIFPRT